MTTVDAKIRIAKLETELAGLRVQIARIQGKNPRPVDVIDSLRTCFTPEDIAAHKEMTRFVYQYRDSEREVKATLQLDRIRRDYNAVITPLKKLGRFKSKFAAAEFAHREFVR
jgi:hypothetical protein